MSSFAGGKVVFTGQKFTGLLYSRSLAQTEKAAIFSRETTPRGVQKVLAGS